MDELSPIRYPAKYIAELFKKVSDTFDPRCATPDDTTAGNQYIFSFSVAPLITDPANYWIVWGGTFDNITGYGWQIFFNLFLIQSPTIEAMLITENSFFVDTANDKIFLHIVYNSWQYLRRLVSVYSNEDSSFSSAPKNEKNPSDTFYSNVKVRPILSIPSIENKLSDAISGIEIYNDFQIEVDNSDGRFNGLDIINYNNTPIRISKNTNNSQSLLDFNYIRKGIISNIIINQNSMIVKGVDRLYRMNKDVCRRITTEEFSGASSNIGDEIPIAWGYHYGKDLIDLYDSGGDYYYIVADKDYLTEVLAVYDKDGASQSFTVNYETGVILTTTEVETCDFIGKMDSRLGVIIKDILLENENIQFVQGVWDVTETETYIDISPEIDLFINSGTTRDLVQEALKNDIAFLIQKNNGLLTLRRWGENYETHDIPAWLITQTPVKDFENANKYFCSSVAVTYSNGQKYIDDSREDEIFDSSNGRSYTAPLETVLHNINDVTDLASRFLDRFGVTKETLNLGFGVDTFEINPLDIIRCEIIINGRVHSEYSSFIVTGCNPAQDQLTLEGDEINYVLTFDDVDASIIDNEYLFSVNS